MPEVDIASLSMQVVIAAFILGALLGTLVHRTNFCTLGSVADIVGYGDWTRMRQWALAVAVAVSVDYRVVILASSDMSHYLPDKAAGQKDQKAIDRILSMDPSGLYETVRSERISMCGCLPAAVMLAAARMLGARSARLVKYMTSGEVSGDTESVVGYAGIVVS